jgi:integrase
MSVYPERRKGRLTGKWIAEVTLPGVGRVRQRVDSLKEGERWEDRAKLTGVAAMSPRSSVEGPPALTLGQVAVECKAAGGPEGAWKRQRDTSVIQRLDDAVTMVGPDTPITQVTTRTYDALVTTLRKRRGQKKGDQLSPSTINRYLTALSCAMTFAESRGHIVGCPKVPWQATDSSRAEWLTPEAECAIVSHMLQQGWGAEALTVRVLTATGMRWGEFAGLEAGQVEDRWIRLWQTKTDTPRSIPIAPELARNLRALAGSGGIPRYDTFRRRLKASLKSAGQSGEFSVHSLRHTTASRLVQRGVNLKVVQQYLGHKTINTTMRYAHIADENLVEAMEKLSPHVGGNATFVDLPKTQPLDIAADLVAMVGVEG